MKLSTRLFATRTWPIKLAAVVAAVLLLLETLAGQPTKLLLCFAGMVRVCETAASLPGCHVPCCICQSVDDSSAA